MADRSALITGITGQDGSYLAELLLSKGYRVSGLVRRLSSPNMGHLAAVQDRISVLDGDLTDQTSLDQAIKAAEPDEVYNLAAQSFVRTSFTQPVLTGEVTGLGALRLLESVRAYAPAARTYQASSSEMFGHVDREPQDETTPFHPRSPYGVAKVYAYWASINYREAYDMFVSNGILFNHESERRGIEFVTRRITEGVARIVAGKSKFITLGNLDARRDWGYAPDYVDFMWRILQHKVPDDFVGATGESHTVREFVDAAFRHAGLDDWAKYVRQDPTLLRPAEVYNLRGDPSKAEKVLGWKARTRFADLVRIMVDADLARGRAAPGSPPSPRDGGGDDGPSVAGV
ncbi:MAG: GDP-mannose 4,6-dehydratase [Thermoplasmata archaeon]